MPSAPLVLVTGFGPFESVDDNPSAHVAEGLARTPPEGVEVVAEVVPVSFERGPRVLAEALGRIAPRVPDLLFGMGVHREAGYRVELRARAELTREGRPDVDGVSARAAHTPPGPDLFTGLREVLERYVDGRADFQLSDEAGGYVCERFYRVQLERGLELDRPALFVHVPHLEHAPVERQVQDLGALIRTLVRG